MSSESNISVMSMFARKGMSPPEEGHQWNAAERSMTCMPITWSNCHVCWSFGYHCYYWLKVIVSNHTRGYSSHWFQYLTEVDAVIGKKLSACLTSHAVICLAPAQAAIIASSPVPVPMSRTLGSSPRSLIVLTACVIAAQYSLLWGENDYWSGDSTSTIANPLFVMQHVSILGATWRKLLYSNYKLVCT